MRFSNIPGLQEEKEYLLKAYKNNHLAHAQLFFGKEGSANLAMALAFTSYLQCENKQDLDSCGTCYACVKTDKLIHPDVHFAFPVSAGTNVKGQRLSGKEVLCKNFMIEWRDWLLKNPYGNVYNWANHMGAENKLMNISKEESRQIIQGLSYKTFEAKYKIMLIWVPEFMHPSAANGILKILEEPPENTIFILVTQDYEKLLPTILSRTQLLRIRQFTPEEIKHYLVEYKDINEGKASAISVLARGSINEALHIMDREGEDQHDAFKEWMRLCWKNDYSSIIEFMEVFNQFNRSSQLAFLDYGLTVLRESLVSKYIGVEEVTMPEREKMFISNFANTLNTKKIEQLNQQISQSMTEISRNANPKIQILSLSLILGEIFRSS
ncbi:MAG TPA: ATP-binding protein [Cyclobacteriaceae bacterium]